MKMPFVAQFYGVWLLLKKFGVILQDSSPPSVVRWGFCCGHGSLRLPCPQQKTEAAGWLSLLYLI